MQHSFDNVLSPDFSEPLQYFDSSPPMSRTTPPIYADDPWNSSSFEDTEEEPDMPHYFSADEAQRKTLFSSNLTAGNVLCKFFIKIYKHWNTKQ